MSSSTIIRSGRLSHPLLPEPALISDGLQPPDPGEDTDVTSKSEKKPKWVMTQAAFDKLLNAFSPDREEAGEQYERARVKLVRFFEWHSVGPADELADETFNRVARRIDEGQRIDNLLGYMHGVAKVLLKEVIRKHPPISLDDAPEVQQRTAPEPVKPDARQECFDRCMEELSREKRDLIDEYYQQELRFKIIRRQKLAERLGIAQNALRIRTHRIRMKLETCITKCLESKQGETNNTL